MPGLVSGIHVLPSLKQERRRWPGHRRAEATPSFGTAMPGHDEPDGKNVALNGPALMGIFSPRFTAPKVLGSMVCCGCKPGSSRHHEPRSIRPRGARVNKAF